MHVALCFYNSFWFCVVFAGFTCGKFLCTNMLCEKNTLASLLEWDLNVSWRAQVGQLNPKLKCCAFLNLDILRLFMFVMLLSWRAQFVFLERAHKYAIVTPDIFMLFILSMLVSWIAHVGWLKADYKCYAL